MNIRRIMKGTIFRIKFNSHFATQYSTFKLNKILFLIQLGKDIYQPST